MIGYDSVKSASRMNNGVVIFLDSVDKVSVVVERGVVIKDTFVQVMPLVNPAKKIILSKVPPFISNEMLQRELARHGHLMSAIKPIPLGCKSPHLKHVVSFRRQVFMILKNNTEELNLILKFRVDDFDYVVHVSSERMKCFGCGMEGHLIRTCPQKQNAGTNNGEPAAPGPEQEHTQSTQQTEAEHQKAAGSEADFSLSDGSSAVGPVSDGSEAAGSSSDGPGAVDLGFASSETVGSGFDGSGAAGPVSVGSGAAGSGSNGSGAAGRFPLVRRLLDQVLVVQVRLVRSLLVQVAAGPVTAGSGAVGPVSAGSVRLVRSLLVRVRLVRSLLVQVRLFRSLLVRVGLVRSLLAQVRLFGLCWFR